jgi:O-antigen ligase
MGNFLFGVCQNGLKDRCVSAPRADSSGYVGIQLPTLGWGLIFLYFLFLSCDVLNLDLVFFKIKLTNGLALLTGAIFIASHRYYPLLRSFILPFTCCLAAFVFSTVGSVSVGFSLGFVLFFVFNYLFYFSLPAALQAFYGFSLTWRIYELSFIAIGCYAMAQVVASLFGIELWNVSQRYGILARGTAFAYEPSYYALYMTPYVFYRAALYVLTPKGDPNRHRQRLIPHLFLLISTSTGCLFSYLFFCAGLLWMHVRRVVRLPIWRIFGRVAVGVGSALSCASVVYPEVVWRGFLKFFYIGLVSHHSFIERWRLIESYWILFVEHPLLGIGYGAGGVELFSRKQGYFPSVDDMGEVALLGPSNVILEILGGLGLAGATAFGFLLWRINRSFKRAVQATQHLPIERAHVLAMGLSLFVTFCTLQFNQSIMRCYLWVHLGMCVAYIESVSKVGFGPQRKLPRLNDRA